MFDELMRAGWPALEEVAVDGWIARFAAGVTNRANSVIPLQAPRELGDALDQVEGLYAERGVNAVFQIGATAEPAGLDQVLAGRGYAFGSPTGVHTVDVDRALARLGPAAVEIGEAGAAGGGSAADARRAGPGPWRAHGGRGGGGGRGDRRGRRQGVARSVVGRRRAWGRRRARRGREDPRGRARTVRHHPGPRPHPGGGAAGAGRGLGRGVLPRRRPGGAAPGA